MSMSCVTSTTDMVTTAPDFYHLHTNRVIELGQQILI